MSSNKNTATTVAIHVVTVRLSSWTEVTFPPVDWKGHEQAGSKSRSTGSHRLKSHGDLPLLHEPKTLNVVIADYLDRMKTRINPLVGHDGAFCCHRFHSVLDYPGIEESG